MKKTIFLLALALAFGFTSCNKENQEPTETPTTPTTQNNSGTSSFSYSGDNLAGKWELDSVAVNDIINQEDTTYLASEVGGTFTMEIYGEVYNSTTDSFDKTDVYIGGDILEVDGRLHGTLTNGTISVDNESTASGILSLAVNDEEKNIYHLTSMGSLGQNRKYILVDDNHILVTALDNMETEPVLWEYFTRVN